MELTTREEFLTWAGAHGIGLRPGCSDRLKYISGVGSSRFWSIPFESAECLSFLSVVLDTIDDWQSMRACPQTEAWTRPLGDRKNVADEILNTIVRWSEIPDGFTGCVRYDEPDRAKLIGLMMIAREFGFHGFHDVFFVPDHGRQILWLSHEAVVFVLFSDVSQIDPFVQRLASHGFPLPTEPPSPFSWQSWMGEKPVDWKYSWEKTNNSVTILDGAIE